LAVAGVAAFERGHWTQSYAKHVCPRLSPKAKMKILFLLHALLKEIQECGDVADPIRSDPQRSRFATKESR
jgi:hypothetical protein